MTRVLLVTGARSLADDPAAEAWARGLIAAALVGTDLLIVGDAPGPDAWALNETTWLMSTTLKVRCYRTHGIDAGWITEPAQGQWWRVARWAEPRSMLSARYPLMRNAAMVADCKEMHADSAWHTVSVLALLDGRKPAVVPPGEKRPTRGTEHTVGLARAAGLTVDARTWGSR